jgi:hypothetical protein
MHPEAVVAHGRGMGSHLEERLRTPVRKMGTRNTAVEAIGGVLVIPVRRTVAALHAFEKVVHRGGGLIRQSPI